MLANLCPKPLTIPRLKAEDFCCSLGVESSLEALLRTYARKVDVQLP